MIKIRLLLPQQSPGIVRHHPPDVTMTTNRSSIEIPIFVEGGGYNNVWIETQPMGGEMYAIPIVGGKSAPKS